MLRRIPRIVAFILPIALRPLLVSGVRHDVAKSTFLSSHHCNVSAASEAEEGFDSVGQKELILDVCRNSLFGDRDTQGALAHLFGKSWLHIFCEALVRGTEWVAQPTIPEKLNLELGSKYDKELWKQEKLGNRGKIPEISPGFFVFAMDPSRAAIQHRHGSPLPPLHLQDGRHIAMVNYRQLRSKMVSQAHEWLCKASKLVDHSLHLYSWPSREKPTWRLLGREKKQRRAYIQVGLLLVGKILHMVADTYSISHAARVLDWSRDARKLILQAAGKLVLTKTPATFEKEILRNASIVQSYSMDDVNWPRFRTLEKITAKNKEDHMSDKMVNYALAHLAVHRVIETLRPWFEDAWTDGAVTSEGSESEHQRNLRENSNNKASEKKNAADQKCNEAVAGSVARDGLGTTTCKCPRGTVLMGSDPACRGHRRFRKTPTRGKGCQCVSTGWRDLCDSSLLHWSPPAYLDIQNECYNKRGLVCEVHQHTNGAPVENQRICMPFSCAGQQGIYSQPNFVKAEVTCPGDGTRWTGKAHHSSLDQVQVKLARVLCDEIFVFKHLDAGAGGSGEGMGHNGNWSAEGRQQLDEKDTSSIDEKFQELISKVDDIRQAGGTSTDEYTPWTYPGPNDPDICEDLQKLQCYEKSPLGIVDVMPLDFDPEREKAIHVDPLELRIVNPMELGDDEGEIQKAEDEDKIWDGVYGFHSGSCCLQILSVPLFVLFWLANVF